MTSHQPVVVLVLFLLLLSPPLAAAEVEPVGLDRELAVPAGALTDFVLMSLRPSIGVSIELTTLPDPERGLLFASDCSSAGDPTPCTPDHPAAITTPKTVLSGFQHTLFYRAFEPEGGDPDAEGVGLRSAGAPVIAELGYRVLFGDAATAEHSVVFEAWPLVDLDLGDAAPRTTRGQAVEDEPWHSGILLVASGPGSSEVSLRITAEPASGTLHDTPAPKDRDDGRLEAGDLLAGDGVATVFYWGFEHFNGPDAFEYTTELGDGFPGPVQSVAVTVVPVNDRPVAAMPNPVGIEGEPLIFSFGAFDVDNEDLDPIHHYPLRVVLRSQTLEEGRLYQFVDEAFFDLDDPFTYGPPLQIGELVADWGPEVGFENRVIYVAPLHANSDSAFPETFIQPSLIYQPRDFELEAETLRINLTLTPVNDPPETVFSSTTFTLQTPTSSASTFPIPLYGFDVDNVLGPLAPNPGPPYFQARTTSVTPPPGDGRLTECHAGTIVSVPPGQNLGLCTYLTPESGVEATPDYASLGYRLWDGELLSAEETAVQVAVADDLGLPGTCAGAAAELLYRLRPSDREVVRLPLPGSNMPEIDGPLPDGVWLYWAPGGAEALEYLEELCDNGVCTEIPHLVPALEQHFVSLPGSGKPLSLLWHQDFASEEPGVLTAFFSYQEVTDDCRRWVTELASPIRIGGLALTLDRHHPPGAPLPPGGLEHVVPGATTLTLHLDLANLDPEPESGSGEIWAEALGQVEMPVPSGCAGLSWYCLALPGHCPEELSGVGPIDHVVRLPPGAKLRFVATCTVPSDAVAGVAAAASITPDPGLLDSGAFPLAAELELGAHLIADLGLSLDAPEQATAGSDFDFHLAVSNLGPSDMPQAGYNNLLPAACLSFTWSCTSGQGGDCGASSGSGHFEQPVALPAGGSLGYDLTCTLSSEAGDWLDLAFEVVPWLTAADPNPGDESVALSIPIAAPLSCDDLPVEDVSNSPPVSNTQTFATSGTLVAGSFHVVAPGGDVTFQAGCKIILGDGFRVDSGATFRAVITEEQ